MQHPTAVANFAAAIAQCLNPRNLRLAFKETQRQTLRQGRNSALDELYRVPVYRELRILRVHCDEDPDG